jgi:hypothetical protein
MKFATLAATLVVWSLSVTGALAGSLSDCATCQGSVYYLTYEMIAQDTTAIIGGKTFEHQDIVRVFYDIDTSQYAPSQPTTGNTYIDQVAQKVSPSINDSYLESAPISIDNWQLVTGGINANGCSGDGGGFACANWVAKDAIGVNVPTSELLSWVFVDTIATGSLLTGTTADTTASIKARYVTDAQLKTKYFSTDGTKIGSLVSENILLTPYQPPSGVPEPASIALFGSVLVGVALASRRRNRNERRP